MGLVDKYPPARTITAPVGKGTLLPMKATVVVPSQLDWVIKRQLSLLILRSRMHTATTLIRLDDLLDLEAAIGQQECTTDYTVNLFGYELKTLRAFLIEHEEGYPLWAPHLIPSPIYWPVRTVLRTFLATLAGLCRRTDLYAARPVSRNVPV